MARENPTEDSSIARKTHQQVICLTEVPMSAVVVDDLSQNCIPAQSLSGRWSAAHVNRKRFGAESNLIRWDTQKLAF
jgi:hypothetical protein